MTGTRLSLASVFRRVVRLPIALCKGRQKLLWVVVLENEHFIRLKFFRKGDLVFPSAGSFVSVFARCERERKSDLRVTRLFVSLARACGCYQKRRRSCEWSVVPVRRNSLTTTEEPEKDRRDFSFHKLAWFKNVLTEREWWQDWQSNRDTHFSC